jgi:hypothetical protein
MQCSKDPHEVSKENFQAIVADYHETHQPTYPLEKVNFFIFSVLSDDGKAVISGLGKTDSDHTVFLQESNPEWFSELVQAGILEKSEGPSMLVPKDPKARKPLFGRDTREKVLKPTFVYRLTEKSKSYTHGKGKASTFLVGRIIDQVTVENYTEPTQLLGITVSQVSYQMKLGGVVLKSNNEESPLPLARVDEARRGEDVITRKAALVKTGEGWLHEKDPRVP